MVRTSAQTPVADEPLSLSRVEACSMLEVDVVITLRSWMGKCLYVHCICLSTSLQTCGIMSEYTR
jgi:hypothetical protein